jgi:hypothetical protein
MKVVISIATNCGYSGMVMELGMGFHLVRVGGTMALGKQHPWPRRTSASDKTKYQHHTYMYCCGLYLLAIDYTT